MTEGADGPQVSLAAATRYIRDQRGLSARALSQKAGLSPSYVGKLEAGEIEPSVRAFVALVNALELTTREILFCVWCASQEATQPQERAS